MSNRWLTEVELRGHGVALEPLHAEHADCLREAVRGGELDHLWYTFVPSLKTLDGYLEQALNMAEAGSALPFILRRQSDKRVVGCTRFCNIDSANQRAEIGYTWLIKSAQRTFVNSACKLLMLSHAFEERDAIAIEFRTHFHNHASRRAIERLGAKQDGVLRQHRKDRHGGYRDTVVFSILDSEWPVVKTGLTRAVERGAAG